MALVVITLQDDYEGNVTLGFTSEPAMSEEDDELSNAQIVGMIAMHSVLQALKEEAEEVTSSIEG